MLLRTFDFTNEEYKHSFTYPGQSEAVSRIFDFHFSPPKLLYMRADTYPAAHPDKTYKTKPHDINEPRFAGDRKPKHAKTKTNIFITF